MQEIVFSVSDFVAVLNQTLDYAYPFVAIEGELTNLRVSRGKWVYFDIKDDISSVKCFGTVYMLPGPLEDGMIIRITASPRLHPLYNFSLNLQTITPMGEGSLKRAADLLTTKLTAEGLFDPSRKRPLPYAPEHVGLITSKESAAYADFVKILDERWAGIKVSHMDVQVQGVPAVADIINAIETINQLAIPPEVIVITRGGGSAEDLAAFNTEQVVRAIAASRIPTLVAIGHEIDTSLAELVADQRASTPSNAAQLLVPDKTNLLLALKEQNKSLVELVLSQLLAAKHILKEHVQTMRHLVDRAYLGASQTFDRQIDLLEALNPAVILQRGYAVVRMGHQTIKSVNQVKKDAMLTFYLKDGSVDTIVAKINKK